MKVYRSAFLFYPVLFLCLLATRPVWAGWEMILPLRMKYDEHRFLAACREGNVPVVRFYLADEDFDPNSNFISGISGEVLTGLYVAAQNGHDKVVQILTDTEGVDINKTWDGAATPLYVASQEGHDKVVQILANTKGVDLNKAWIGATPLFVASQEGHDRVVQILASTEGVDLNQAYNGVTPLYMASEEGHDKVVRILADTKGIDLNQACDDTAPVFIASQEGHDKVVQILAHAKGVDLNQAYNGATPVFMASQNGHDKVVQHLVDAGADPTIEYKFKYRFGEGAVSMTARTSATEQRHFTEKWNPEKYDAYSNIIQTLGLAEQQWEKKDATLTPPIDDRGYVHWAGLENHLLMARMRRLSMTGKCQ